MGTAIELTDVKGSPEVLLGNALPGPMRLGDTIKAKFQLSQRKDGRTFTLEFDGVLRVVGVSFEIGPTGSRQRLKVEAIGSPPVWKAVRNPPMRTLPPAKFPRTKV